MTFTEHDHLVAAVSDAFKELNGFRPRHYNFDVMSVTQLEDLAEEIYGDIEYRNNWEEIEVDRNMVTFLKYAPDAATAQRWATQAVND